MGALSQSFLQNSSQRENQCSPVFIHSLIYKDGFDVPKERGYDVFITVACLQTEPRVLAYGRRIPVICSPDVERRALT